MSLYGQPNEWSCGPFALKHALLVLGRMVHESEIQKLAKANWWAGTDEIRLAKAARAFGCELKLHRYLSASNAKRELSKCLRRGVPAIVCVDDWEHWLTVVRVENDMVVMIDSNADPVVDITKWSRFKRRWQYRDLDYDEDDPPILFDFFAVEPQFRRTIRADFSVARAKFLRRPANRNLAEHWTTYVEDLLEICRPADVRMVEPLSMAEFLRRNQDVIVARLKYWHGAIEPTQVAELLGNYRFVAETYGLVIPQSKARQALVDIAILVAFWATVLDPVEDMYGVSRD